MSKSQKKHSMQSQVYLCQQVERTREANEVEKYCLDTYFNKKM